MKRGGCQGCGGRLFFHEREAWPQAFCRACAAERGLVRLADAGIVHQGRELEAAVRDVVAETLEDMESMTAAQLYQQTEMPRDVGVACALAELGQLGAGDVIALQIHGAPRIPTEQLHWIAEVVVDSDPDRALAPIIVVPHGELERVKRCAIAAERPELIALLIEAPRIAVVGVAAERAAERAHRRWFERDRGGDQ